MSHRGIDLNEQAVRHLWGHFTNLNESTQELRIIERGEGCYVWDDKGNRYLDGLAGLFASQVGNGRTEIAEAAAAQSSKLGYFPIWTFAHPTAIELATRIASHAPDDLNRIFFTAGGSMAVESAWKLARGAGYFYGIELAKHNETRETFSEDEADDLLRGIRATRLFEPGLICRADDRGEPVIQLSPPLIAGPAEFEETGRILRQALAEAMKHLENMTNGG